MLLRCGALPCVLLLAGCPLFGEETLPECNVVDANDVVLVASSSSNVIFDLQDGSEIPLFPAPQGGHIMLAGARFRTTASCQVSATAALRDPVSQRVIALEQRPLLLERRSDGWAVPREGIDAMPNIAPCPSAAATSSIDGNPYLLEVALTTLDGAPIATRSVTITPTCADDFCRSNCAPSP